MIAGADKYGIDRPDTRFGLELKALAATTVPEEMSSKGESLKGLCVPGGASFSRKRLDDLEKGAKSQGATLLAWIKLPEAGGWNSNSKKLFGDAAIESLRATFDAGGGDLILLAGGSDKIVNDLLGGLRVQIAREENLVPEGRFDFLWVTGFPLVEWHPEDRRWYAMHHPFTSPVEEDRPLLESDPARVRARAYDVVLNGMELGGGSIRIHRPEVQSRVFTRLGMEESIRNSILSKIPNKPSDNKYRPQQNNGGSQYKPRPGQSVANSKNHKQKQVRNNGWNGNVIPTTYSPNNTPSSSTSAYSPNNTPTSSTSAFRENLRSRIQDIRSKEMEPISDFEYEEPDWMRS